MANSNGTLAALQRIWPYLVALVGIAVAWGVIQTQVSRNVVAIEKSLPIAQFMQFEDGLDKRLTSIEGTLKDINYNLIRMNRRGDRTNEPR